MKKKQEEKNIFGGGISTKSYKPKKRAEGKGGDILSSENTQTTIKTNKKKIIIAVIAAVLSAVLIIGIVLAVISDIEDKKFDYLSTDLSHYLEIERDTYLGGYNLNIDISKPTEDDLKAKIYKTLATDISTNVINSSGLYKQGTIAIGDDIFALYRGYTVEDGKEVNIWRHNYQIDPAKIEEAADSAVTVGSGEVMYGTFIGFEEGLVGVKIEDIAKFEKITDRAAAAGDVVYISGTRLLSGADESRKEHFSYERLDLTDEQTKDEWLSVLIGRKPGDKIPDFTLTADGKEYSYTNTKIEFLTVCEKADNVLKIETRIADNGQTEEAAVGKTVYFDVFVEKMIYHNEWHVDENAGEYDISYDLNDAYIAAKIADGTLGITSAELDLYEGESLVDKYESYVSETLHKEYEKNRNDLIQSAMWDYFFTAAKIKKYPKSRVDDIYNKSYSSLMTAFTSSEGYIYDKYKGYAVTCQTLDEYALIYFDLQYAADQSWENKLYNDARDLVAERLIIYYILKKENLVPTKERLSELVAEIKAEFVELYITSDKTAPDKSDTEKYEKYLEEVKETINSGYAASYFEERAYTKIVFDSMLPYANIVEG